MRKTNPKKKSFNSSFHPYSTSLTQTSCWRHVLVISIIRDILTIVLQNVKQTSFHYSVIRWGCILRHGRNSPDEFFEAAFNLYLNFKEENFTDFLPLWFYALVIRNFTHLVIYYCVISMYPMKTSKHYWNMLLGKKFAFFPKKKSLKSENFIQKCLLL